MDHPWRRFRAKEGWTLIWSTLPDGLKGFTDHTTHTVLLDKDLQQTDRRCTICHELAHIERGPVPSDPILKAREESAVERQAARELIDLDALLDALKWAHNVPEAADVLWVSDDVLKVRMEHLQPDERAWIEENLADP